MSARATGNNPFLETETTTVRSNGSWAATLDFSDVPVDTQFSIDVQRNGTGLLDATVDGRVVSRVTADNDSYVAGLNTTLSVPAAGVLANDTEADGDPLTASVLRGPSNGTLTLNDDGSFEYTPDPDFSGEDEFTYEARDQSSGGADNATVTVTVKETIIYSDLSVSKTAVVTNESVDVSATVTNNVSSSRSYTAELRRNGTVVDTKSGTLAAGPGTDTVVTFTTSFADGGTYDVTIDDLPPTAVSVVPSISGCQVVDESGRYVLDGDITENATGGCIEITASDVVLDGQGHTLDGVDPATGMGGRSTALRSRT